MPSRYRDDGAARRPSHVTAGESRLAWSVGLCRGVSYRASHTMTVRADRVGVGRDVSATKTNGTTRRRAATAGYLDCPNPNGANRQCHSTLRQQIDVTYETGP